MTEEVVCREVQSITIVTRKDSGPDLVSLLIWETMLRCESADVPERCLIEGRGMWGIEQRVGT